MLAPGKYMDFDPSLTCHDRTGNSTNVFPGHKEPVVSRRIAQFAIARAQRPELWSPVGPVDSQQVTECDEKVERLDL